MAQRFDAIILGAGQAGVPLATALADAGWTVAVVERAHVGGSCINEGCTPTKTMVASARVADLARRAADYGVRTGDVRVDLRAVRARKRAVVESFRAGNEERLEGRDGIALIEGEARFTAPRRVRVACAEGGERELTADHVFINVGARPTVPELAGLATVPYLDNVGLMELEAVPEHLVVVGGGYIGVEFAQMFRRFGSRVTLLQRNAQLLTQEDEDVSQAVEALLLEDGVVVLTEADATAVRRQGDGVALQVRVDGGERTVAGSHLLIAVGRTSNADALDLAAAGVAVDGHGFVGVDDHLRSSAEGVYALGDVKGGPAFTHVSYDDYRIVRADLLGGGATHGWRQRPTPYTVFLDPQLGRVGLNERQARAAGRRYRTARLPMSRVARAIETGETRGFMKVLVDPDDGAILGAAILAVEGGELATMVQFAMMGGLTAADLRDAVITHPLLAEAFNTLFAQLDEGD